MIFKRKITTITILLSIVLVVFAACDVDSEDYAAQRDLDEVESIIHNSPEWQPLSGVVTMFHTGYGGAPYYRYDDTKPYLLLVFETSDDEWEWPFAVWIHEDIMVIDSQRERISIDNILVGSTVNVWGTAWSGWDYYIDGQMMNGMWNSPLIQLLD